MIGENENPRLDLSVILQRKVATRDEIGGEVITWQDMGTAYAGRVQPRGGRFFTGESKHYDQSFEYVIRWREDVKPGWRLVHGDDVFEIIAVIPGVARKKYLSLAVRGLDQTVGMADREEY